MTVVACLDENTIAALISGDLPEGRREAVREHLEGCTACSELVASLMRDARGENESVSEGNTLPSPLSSPLSTDEPRLERVGRYLILELLGTGGMGHVHKAFDPVLERNVALKLVRQDRAPVATEEVKARLLREGRAIAQLNHPNIVSIFDMGVERDEVFVAMELVEGGSLKRWLTTVPRTWRAVLAVYLDAGRGLAAAHRAGLVHRDFKPENVLIGSDGRVRVSDFGLSTSISRAPLAITMPETDPTDERLTQTGALLGTPAYMAPEQWAGRQADALSDQFSFCLALWEGVFGCRPFEQGKGRPTWRWVEPPKNEVPPSLKKALERGLSVDPRQRFPSMEALVSALEPRRRTRALWLTAPLVVLGLAGLAWQSTPRCTGAKALAEAVWNPKVLKTLEHVLSTEPAIAGLVRERLDAYVSGWTSMHTEACEASRVRGEQSDQVLTLRMTCLERRRVEVRELLGVLVASKPDQTRAATEAVNSLTPLELCANIEGLLANVPPPTTHETQKLVDTIRDELARARALLDLGRYEEAATLASHATTAARSSEYSQVLAEALTLEGQLGERRGDLKEAEKLLLEALGVSEAARHDVVRAEATIALMLVLGVRQARSAEAATWDALAQGALSRVGGSPWLEARLFQTRGLIRYAEGKLPEAIELQRKAADTYARLDREGIQRALALNELGAAYRGARDAPHALAAYHEALDILRRRLGEESDSVAASRNGLANTLMLEGRLDEAKRLYVAVLEVFEKRLGPKHFRTVTGYNNLGVVLAEQERYAEALPWFEKVVAARDAQAADPKAADAHANLGMLLLELDRLDDAQAEFERARVLLQGVPADHFSNAEPLLGLATLALERRKGSEAERFLQRALQLCEGKQGFRFESTRARAQFLTARLLTEVKGQRIEGLELARTVKKTFEELGASRFRRDVSNIEKWLAAEQAR
jgi:eukaryotic-like serine/threonine-protein kinase